jgi:hypothetical protein
VAEEKDGETQTSKEAETHTLEAAQEVELPFG